VLISGKVKPEVAKELYLIHAFKEQEYDSIVPRTQRIDLQVRQFQRKLYQKAKQERERANDVASFMVQKPTSI